MAGTQSIGTELWLKKAGEEQADTKIAHLTSVGEVKGEAEEIDVTDHDSPNGNKEYIAGAVDYGTFEFEGNLCDATLAEKMFALLNGKNKRDWYIKYTDGSRMDIKGALQSFGLSERTTDGLNQYSGGIRVSETPTYSPTGEPAGE
jgi:hypothetical protein